MQQNLRLREQVAVERTFADRLLDDAPTPMAVADIVAAVGHLEAALAVTGTLGYIHASPALVAAASAANLVQRSGTGLTTPPGHKWVFGGGYVDGLDAVLVATSPTFGWRDQVAVRGPRRSSTTCSSPSPSGRCWSATRPPSARPKSCRPPPRTDAESCGGLAVGRTGRARHGAGGLAVGRTDSTE